MSNFKYTLSLLIIAKFLVACQKKQELPQEVIASFGDNILTKKEVVQATLGAKNQEDSFFLATKFVRSWMKRQVLIYQANQQLGQLSEEQQKLIDTYEGDLQIHELRKKNVKEISKMEITDTDLFAYYQSNKKNFELKENIVQLEFIKIPNQYKNMEQSWNYFKRNKKNKRNKLVEYVQQNDGFQFNDTNKWLRFVDVLKEIPINTYNEEHFLSNNKFIRIKDQSFTYFIRILNFKIKDDLSPFTFEKEKIKEILINKRKISFLDSIENKMIRDAIQNNKLKLYQ